MEGFFCLASPPGDRHRSKAEMAIPKTEQFFQSLIPPPPGIAIEAKRKTVSYFRFGVYICIMNPHQVLGNDDGRS